MIRWLSALVLSPLLALGDSEVSNDYQPPALSLWSETSPNGQLMAAERIVPDPIYLWKTDFDGARLLIRTFKTSGSDTYIAYDLPRLISKIQWSPDSQYIVMTTVSAGGHSPWHFCAYVYVVSDGSLRYMDDTVGLVVAPDVKFSGPHTVILKVAPRNGTGAVDFDSGKPTSVDLTKGIGSMEKQKGKTEGKME